MKNYLYLLLVVLFAASSLSLQAQNDRLFMAREFKNAYEKGTRSYDGRPGPKYWHNTADYKMEIAIDPAARTLEGTEEVVYTNNSPDALNTLVVRLYQDVFRKGNTRDYPVSPDDIHDGVQISRLEIDGEAYDLDNRREASRQGSNLVVQLKAPLAPGGKLTMQADWSILIPETNIRMGVYDSTTFFVAYFYPQISVYDDVFGWDRLSYGFRTEFYNNLGNFDVTIKAPEEFTIWATGVLQNPEKIYPPQVYDRYIKAQKSTETIEILSEEDFSTEAGYRNLSGTWRYVADEVIDFAFGISDHFGWNAAMQNVDGREVLIGTAYPADKAERHSKVTSITQKAMKHMSEDVPGIPYPYPQFTTFIGSDGGGMEFPMMANNSGPGRGVTIHELFHTYFPMYVRVNESRFAWMDEGWATYITDWVVERYFENNQEPLFLQSGPSISGAQGGFSDIPLISSSQFMDDSNYGYSAYPLPAFVYGVLHHHLGDDLFLKCYREYIRRWAQKSPTPYDFFFTFENVSGQDLSWLWKPWFFEFGYPDVAIESFKKDRLVVRNKGNRPVPLTIDIAYRDGKQERLVWPASVWNKGALHEARIPNAKDAERIIVNQRVPDFNSLDNLSPTLAELYKNQPASGELVGKYQVKEFPMELSIEQKEGALFLSMPRMGQASYLLPEPDGVYRSLNGEFSVKVTTNEQGAPALKINTAFFEVSAEKK